MDGAGIIDGADNAQDLPVCGTSPGSFLMRVNHVKRALLGIKRTGIAKGTKFSYPYFELGDIMPVLIAELERNGLFMQISFPCEMAELTIQDVERRGSLVYRSPLPPQLYAGDDIKELGAVQTYMRRYLIILAFDIVEVETPGDKARTRAGAGQQSGTVYELLSDEIKEEINGLLARIAPQARTLFGKQFKEAKTFNEIVLIKAALAKRVPRDGMEK